MTSNDDPIGERDKLRLRAEEMVRERDAASSRIHEALSSEATAPILHELRVHQIELEMQNEELRRAQVELDAIRERYFDLFELAPVGYCTVSEKGLILEANLTAAKLLGVAKGALVTQPFSRFVFPDDRGIHYLSSKQLLETGGPLVWELRLLRRGSVPFWARVEATAAQDDRGASVWRAVVSDIAERKRAEESVRESERRFDELATQSRSTTWEVDSKGLFTYVSHVSEASWGYRPDEVVGRMHFYDLHPEEGREAFKTAVFAVTGRKQPFRDVVHAVETKDGRVVWSSTNGMPLLAADGTSPGYRGNCTDITERKRAEEEAESLQLQLAHAQKMESIGRLAGGIAHDFSNLMSVILLHGESALEELRSGDPLTEAVTAMVESAHEAIEVTQQLMAFGRKQVPRVEVLNLHLLVAGWEKLVRPLIGEDIHLEFISGSGLGLVKADPGQVGQIILNLAVNSRDAMPRGGTLTIETVDVELDESHVRVLSGAEPGTYVMLVVRDAGVGMDQETQARIFEPFFTTKEAGKGTGLGLSTVYGIVKESGGFITLQSEQGRGTEFKIYLPRMLETSEPVRDAVSPSEQRGVETILVVEDQSALRAPVCRLLERAGYQVLVGENVEKAIQIATQHEGLLDVLLTDVVMPNMSGPQLAGRLQPLRPQMKVLYMSGYPEPRQPNSVLASGVNLIQKPFTRQKLLRRLREVLDGRELPR